ncbi:GntR family transcriptional regulator [Bordetella genomosp. 13]|uniref:GntR family transcriptional regulator n=1 Tax=Bordetella genomosp. 13 TaxID=463040 RepID=A0A1W6ZJB0_9BORD|nr:GntR family transcriptional regulator [Bordetella genomosp. 13]ARP97335.1 GntR family transcriptional regulator [Bordetella genomosp. 13]
MTKADDIRRDLIDAITSGRYAVGELLPTEFELCEQYGASRYTIRAVLQQMQDQGLVSRRKNVGTRVASARPRPVFQPPLSTVEDLVQFGVEHLRVVQSIKMAALPDELAALAGQPPGTRWLRVSNVRMERGRQDAPMAWTDVFVDPVYSEVSELVRQSPDTLISTMIEARHGRRIAEIRQDVSATTVHDARAAAALGIEAGAAALKILRAYLDEAGEAFVVSITLHPADSLTISMRLHRTAG